MNATHFALILFAFSAAVTPGPNNILILASGVNHGLKKSLPHLIGIAIGVFLLFAIIGCGFGVILTRYPWLHQVVQGVGIVYLIYLTWLIANSKPTSLEADRAPPFTFTKAVLFQWINPKVWIVASSVVATYTTDVGSFYLQVLAISALFGIVTLPCVAIWLLFGVQLKTILSNPHRQKIFNWTMAFLLFISIIPAIIQWKY